MAKSDNEIDIKLNIDTSALSDLDNLASSVPDEINIEVNATGDFSDLGFDEIPDEITPEVNVTETPEGKKVVDAITFLALKEKIETVINVIGTAVDFVKDIGALTVAPFLDIEDAVARINAQTGGTGIADLGQFIRDIQAADLGDSVEQIADVAIKAQQMNLPMQEAATAALTFTHTFKDEDPTAVLKPLADLVKTGLVPDMQTAADLMTVFFQAGGNQGGDALNTVQKYSTAWADMGLTLSEALSLVSSLMAGGVDTSEAAAKMVQTADDAFTKAAQDPSSPEANMLRMMHIDNPKEQGKAIGADTIEGFASAFDDLSVEDQDFASKMFFGKGGALNTGAIAGMTTQSDMFKDYKDAAALAATEVDNSLRGAIADFVLAVNTTIATLLSSDAIDLPSKIAALKEGFQEAVAVLAGGGTVGEALEVALNIPGLSNTLNTFIGNFERIIGNVEILFLQLVASIQDLTGHGKEAEGTRATIKGLAGKQLAFDLQLGTADEIGAQITQAFSRGLTTSDLGDAVDTALNESIANANFDQGATVIQGLISAAIANGASPEAANAMATDFVTKLDNGFDNALAAGNVDLMQKMIAIGPNGKVPGLDDAVTAMKKQLSDAFAPAQGEANAVNPFTSTFQGISTAFTDAFPGQGKGGATSNTLLGGLITQANDLKTTFTDTDNALGASFGHIGTTVDTMNTNVGTSLDAVQTNMEATGTAAQEMDTTIATAMLTNTVTASFEAVALAADTSFPIVLNWFGRTAQGAALLDSQISGSIGHMSKLLHDLQFLSAAVAQGVKDAIQVGSHLPGAGAGGGGATTVNNNVNQTNNNQNGAQTAASTYEIAAAIGGP